MKKRWKRWAVAGASALLATAGVELVCRVAFEAPVYHHGMPFEPVLGYRMPSQVSLENHDANGAFPFVLNSLGSRGRELPAAGDSPPVGTSRIAFVGDSMWTAWAVRPEKHMGALTEDRARERGRSVEVYGLGCDDYGTAQELLLFERYADRVQPEAVVLLLFVGNDVLNNGLELAGSSSTAGGDYLRPYFVKGEDGSLHQTHVHPLPAFLRDHSRAYSLLEHGMLTLGAAHDIAWLRPFSGRRAHGSGSDDPLEVFREHAVDSEWGQAWEVTEALLRRFRDEVASRGARFLVLAIPDAQQVEVGGRGLFSRFRQDRLGGPDESGHIDWNHPQRRLAEFFAAEAIEWVDLLPLLRDEVQRLNRPAFVYDGHLDSGAHGIIAETVARWLTEGPTTRPREVRSEEAEPVCLLPPPEAMPSWLNFREEPAARYLAHGWLDWRPDWEGSGGWAMERLGVLYLRPAGGDFILRGFLPSGAILPVQVQISIHGVGSREAVLASDGPFELRFPCDVASLGDRYVPFFIGTDRSQPLPPPDSRQSGLVVHEVGFESSEPSTTGTR